MTNTGAAYRDLKKGIEEIDQQTTWSTIKGIRDLVQVLKDVIHQLRVCGQLKENTLKILQTALAISNP